MDTLTIQNNEPCTYQFKHDSWGDELQVLDEGYHAKFLGSYMPMTPGQFAEAVAKMIYEDEPWNLNDFSEVGPINVYDCDGKFLECHIINGGYDVYFSAGDPEDKEFLIK